MLLIANPLLQRNQDRDHALSRIERLQRLADYATKGSLRFDCFHGVTWHGRRGQHVANLNTRWISVNLAPDLPGQGKRTAIICWTPVKDNSRTVASCTGDDASDTPVVRHVTDSDLVVARDYHNGPGLGIQTSNNFELLRQVGTL
jgi:hypothetical protein